MKMSIMRVFTPLALSLLLSHGVVAGKHEQDKSSKIVVTNTNDSGAGSLREAVEKANNCQHPTRIVFNIPKCDPGYNKQTKQWVIQTESSIEVTAQDVTIDGYSQKGAKPNTNCHGQPSNACIKVVVKMPPLLTGATAEAFTAFAKALIAQTGVDAKNNGSKEASTANLIAQLLFQDPTPDLTVEGSATAQGVGGICD